jgi:hypothetical protein
MSPRLAVAGWIRPRQCQHRSEAEYRALRLPLALYGLYYVFRPLRLMAKYIRHATGWY